MTEVKNNYTLKDMKDYDNKLKDNIKYFSLLKDFVIKELFSKNPTIYKEILILFIEEIIKLDSKITKISYDNSELGKSNYKEYNKTIDSYVKLNNNIHIDLECNSALYKDVKRRNILYLNKISTKVLETGENIKKLNSTYLIQININTSSSDNKYGYEHFLLVGNNSGKRLTNFEHICVFNIEYYRRIFYNGVRSLKKFELWLVVFSSKNFQELYNTLNYVTDEETRDHLIREVYNMFSDGFRLDDWKKEHADVLNEMVRHDMLENAREEGIQEGIQEGEELGRAKGLQEAIISTIKSMLKEKCSVNLISKVTGKTLHEIKEIQQSM